MRLLLLLLLSCSLGFLFNVNGQEPTTEKKPPLQIKLLAVTAPADLGQVCLLSGDTKSAAFDLPMNNVSDAIAVTQRSLILKTVNKELPLCTIQLPEAGKEFIAVLMPAKPAGYQVHVIRTDDPSFQRGGVFFLNLTTQTILGKLGTKALILEAGKASISRPDGPTAQGYYDIAFATRNGEEDRLFSSSRWPIDDHIRSYLFFVQDETGRITYRAVDEFMPADKQP